MKNIQKNLLAVVLLLNILSLSLLGLFFPKTNVAAASSITENANIQISEATQKKIEEEEEEEEDDDDC